MEKNNLIDVEFIKFLDGLKDESAAPMVNFNELIELLERENIPVKAHNEGKFSGLATMYGLYFNLNHLVQNPNIIVYYIILHEIGHYKRFKKLGKSYILNSFSQDDFNKWANGVIDEEIIADKYAAFTYYKLTGKIIPEYCNQKLHLNYIRERYMCKLKETHVNVENDETKYKETLKKLFNIDV
jgi:hypothetical protein